MFTYLLTYCSVSASRDKGLSCTVLCPWWLHLEVEAILKRLSIKRWFVRFLYYAELISNLKRHRTIERKSDCLIISETTSVNRMFHVVVVVVFVVCFLFACLFVWVGGGGGGVSVCLCLSLSLLSVCLSPSICVCVCVCVCVWLFPPSFSLFFSFFHTSFLFFSLLCFLLLFCGVCLLFFLSFFLHFGCEKEKLGWILFLRFLTVSFKMLISAQELLMMCCMLWKEPTALSAAYLNPYLEHNEEN